MIKTRIAPSPTGYLHIGTARTALINYLYAKQHKGKFVLRIEDTDKERSRPEYEKDIIESLKWLKIFWDEGVEVGGEHGPYRQSERGGIYKKYIEKLKKLNIAYHCFCSEEELKKHKEAMLIEGKPAVYSKKCRTISKEEAAKRIAKGERSIIRIKVPENEEISFSDLIKGKISFNSSLIGDIAIAKDEQTPLYNFAVVIDDYEMHITDVIRGEDHISNTPKQIIIQKMLNIPTPRYAHLPLVLNKNKQKLSKRDGALSVMEYKKMGYLPEAIINFLVMLGWNPGDDREIFSLDELIKEFDIKKIQKSGAVFNIEKLNWYNSYYIKKANPQKITKLAIPFLKDAKLINQMDDDNFITKDQRKIDEKYIENVIKIEQTRIKTISELPELVDFFFDEVKPDKDMLIWKKSNQSETKKALSEVIELLLEIKEFNEENTQNALMKVAEKYGNGAVFWPVRVSLSGKKASPSPSEIMSVLGREESLKRIKNAKNLL